MCGRAGDRPHWQRTFLACPRPWAPSTPVTQMTVVMMMMEMRTTVMIDET